MRVGIDCRYIKVDSLDGIGRFTIGLAHALAEELNIELLVADQRVLELLPNVPHHQIRSETSPLEPLVALQVNQLGLDVVFSPMQTMGSLGKQYRLILTIHDLIYYTYRTPPRSLPWWVRVAWRLYHLAWWPQRMLLAGADAVVTVSRTSRVEILNKRLTKRPVVVVPNAADAMPPASTPLEQPRECNVVYMGSFQPYKDVETLAQGVALVPGATLHLLSRCTLRDEQRIRKAAPEANLVFHNGVTDEQYQELLDGATALASASRAEGFGIPLIEAGRRGVPLLLADTPIFREVGSDAAEYFQPGSASECAEAVERLQKPKRWNELSVRSSDNAANYNWADSGARLADLIRSVASGESSARTW